MAMLEQPEAAIVKELQVLVDKKTANLGEALAQQIANWTEVKAQYQSDEYVTVIRDKEIRTALKRETL